MRLFILISIYFFLVFNEIISQELPFINSRDLSVMIHVSEYSDNSVELTWSVNPLATSYEVRRKLPNEPFFPQSSMATVTTTNYTDNTVQKGVLYEYEVRAISAGRVTLQIGGQDTNVAVGFLGFGYTAAGKDLDIHYESKTVLLLVDETMFDYLEEEIISLEKQLLYEGWGVRISKAPRAENFDGELVKETKAIIKSVYDDTNGSLSTVFIIGRVPVPYSGNIVPDGHTNNHHGAWPADLYYGFLDESFWTDISTVSSNANRTQNQNAPGDGKFDQSHFIGHNSGVELQIGRVDFYDMPEFEMSEAELLKAYLQKDLKFRNGETEYLNKGLIDDNFAARRLLEAFASNGWRNFGNWLGGENIENADLISTLSESPYLASYGCGGGTYTSAGGIGNTADFASNNINGIVVILFGSYFGDWDSRNNFLRAALASQPNALITCWAARPHWFMHHLTAGYNFGYSTRLSQNNYNTYIPNFYNINNGLIQSVGNRNIHVALLGDPTLTLYPNPLNQSLAASYSRGTLNAFEFDLSNSEDLGYGFDIFRALDSKGPYERINAEPILDANYSDTFHYEGEVFYKVKQRNILETNSGSIVVYNNEAEFEDILKDLSSVEIENDFSIELYPLPAKDYIIIDFSINNQVNAFMHNAIEILDLRGQVVDEMNINNLGIGQHKIRFELNLENGVYFIKIPFGRQSVTKKFTIVK